MAEKPVEERIAAIEAQLGHIPIEEHFREQAELIDRVFVYRFEEFERKWEARLESLESRLGSLESRLDSLESRLGMLESTLESTLDAKLKPVRIDLSLVKHAVGVILTRLT
jgi:uncharacterized coiled-coil protein SlyX